MATRIVRNLMKQYATFCRERVRPNPDQPVDGIEHVLEFYRDLERRGVDMGSPTDEELIDVLKEIGIGDPDQQARAIEAAADWQLADRAGRPVIGARAR